MIDRSATYDTDPDGTSLAGARRPARETLAIRGVFRFLDAWSANAALHEICGRLFRGAAELDALRCWSPAPTMLVLEVTALMFSDHEPALELCEVLSARALEADYDVRIKSSP